jgi:hypothetical protein
MMHVGMSGLLRGTMAHEMNHSINSYPAGTQGNREDGTNESYSEDETAMYDDKPSEHRSNIQQLRYIFNLSPSATVTETDVARMRKECKEKGIAIWLFSNPDKYTDKRIAEMFNLFVQNDNQDKLSQRNLAGIGGLLRKPV